MKKRALRRKGVRASRAKLAVIVVTLLVVLYFVARAALCFFDRTQVNREVQDLNSFFSWEKTWQAASAVPAPQEALCMLGSDGAVHYNAGEKNEDDIFYMSEAECRATLGRALRPMESTVGADGRAAFPAQPISCSGEPCPLFSFVKRPRGAASAKATYEFSIPTWRRVTPSAPAPPAPAAEGVPRLQKAADPSLPTHCPTSYATVQLQGYGRMQNQMQSVVNAVLWSRHLNRTFVLPPLCWNITCCWDAVCRSRLDMERFYDFSSWQADGFCVISYDTFLKESEKETRSTQVPKQLHFYYAPMDRKRKHPLLTLAAVHLEDFMLPSDGDSRPSHDASARRVWYNVTREPFPSLTVHPLKGEAARARPEDWLVLSAGSAFFLRFPLAGTLQLFGLLRPSAPVQERVRAILAANPPDFATVGLHLRSREGTCSYEAATLASKLGPSHAASPHAIFMSRTFEREVMWECTPNAYGVLSRVAYAAAELLLRETKQTAFDAAPVYHGLSFLIATDQQSQDVLSSVHNKWDDLYPKWVLRNLAVGRREDAFVLLASDVAVDFFVLTAVDVFWGNRLSAVSQNVCMWRLYNGKACHGFAGGILPFNFQDV